MAWRILIVDDEPALQSMVGEILTQAGYETESAFCCAQAVERFRTAVPDAVLLDVMLPDGDGFSLLGTLRELRDVPVLFLSARDEDEARLKGLGLGADDYITKPFLPQELLLRLLELPHPNSSYSALLSPSASVPVTPPPAACLCCGCIFILIQSGSIS